MTRLSKILSKSAAMAIVASSFMLGSALAAQSYTIRSGDTLWKVSQANHISLAAIIAANPHVQANNLQVGQVLNIPSSSLTSTGAVDVPTTGTTAANTATSTYTVATGDTEWLIAKRSGVSVQTLAALNPGLNALDLQPGQTLRIPSSASSSSANSNLYWMSRAIAAEAQGQPYSAKLAVASVIENRMHSPYYASTVQGVLFQTINGHAQFTSVANGWINQVTPSAADLQAASQALSGTDNVPGAYVFYNAAQTPANSWVRTQPTVAVYGNLTFAQ